MRWVGIDARTAEAQAIIDTFGSTITAFHMQQAHNHSLSLNTQSRGFLQIAPNIGVEYVNQGGMEYITISVQAAKAEEPKLEAEEPVKPVVCWYPTEDITGTVAPSEDLQFVDLPIIQQVRYSDYESTDVAVSVVAGTISLNFSEPLNVYGTTVTEIGVHGSTPSIWLGAPCSAPDMTYAVSPLTAPVLSFYGSPLTTDGGTYERVVYGYVEAWQTVSASVQFARGTIGGVHDARNYVVLRWLTTFTKEYGQIFGDDGLPTGAFHYRFVDTFEQELTIVEALRRPGRAPCPALIGMSSIGRSTTGSYDGSVYINEPDYNKFNTTFAVIGTDWVNQGYLASTNDYSAFGSSGTPGTYPGANWATGFQPISEYFGAHETPILRTWLAFDPDTGLATLLSPNFRWIDSRSEVWPPPAYYFY